MRGDNLDTPFENARVRSKGEKFKLNLKFVPIKSAMSFSAALAANLDTYLRKWDDGSTRATLVYDGKTFTTGSGIRCANFRDWKLPQ